MKQAYLFPLLLLYLNCSTFSSAGTEKQVGENIEELLAAQDTVIILKTKVSLETYLWRDFMPTSPPDGRSRNRPSSPGG